MEMNNNNIKEIRKNIGFSQKEVAKNLKVTQSTVSSWEAGRYEPDSASLQKLADLFNVTVDALLGRINSASSIREDTTEYISRPKETQEVMIPLIFSIRNIGTQQNTVKYIPVPTSYVSRYGRNIVGIVAAGESMSPTLSPGNYLICIPGKAWENDQIVVVDVNDSETVKRIRRTADGGIDLIPDNKDFEDMHFSPTDINNYKIRILGRVVRSISPEL